MAFVKASAVRTGLTSAEPTLGVTSSGTAFFYFSIDRSVSASEQLGVGRSTDGGRTWEHVVPQVRHIQSFDPYMFVDSVTDRVFVLDLHLACLRISHSDDEGSTWVPGEVCGDAMDHPTAAIGPPVGGVTLGYPNVIYACWGASTATGVEEFDQSARCARSIDGGATFLRLPGGPVDWPCLGRTGHLHVGSDGTLYLPHVCFGDPHLAISHDEGVSWQDVAIPRAIEPILGVGYPGHEAAVGVDAAGSIYYLWLEQNRLPYLTVSGDGGGTWSRPRLLRPPGVNETNLPALATAPDGSVAVAFMGTRNSPGRPWGRWEPCLGFGPSRPPCPPEPDEYRLTTWNGYVMVSPDASRARPRFYWLAANPLSDPLVRGTCGPIRCHAVADFIDVQFAPNGDVWASFVDDCIEECVRADKPIHNGSEAIIVRVYR